MAGRTVEIEHCLTTTTVGTNSWYLNFLGAWVIFRPPAATASACPPDPWSHRSSE